ncbi:hypothetical protein V6N13_136789 [Hibiscus sabdariffa]
MCSPANNIPSYYVDEPGSDDESSSEDENEDQDVMSVDDNKPPKTTRKGKCMVNLYDDVQFIFLLKNDVD